MSEAQFVEMVVLSGAAAGLVLLGIAKAFLGGRSRPVRLAAVAGCALLAGALPAAVGFPALAGVSSAVVLGAAVLSAAASWPRLTMALSRLQSRGVQAGILAGIGGVVFVGSLSRYEMAEAAASDRDMEFMTDVTWKPPLSEETAFTAATDSGRPVPVHRPASIREKADVATAEQRVIGRVLHFDGVIRTGPATDEFNCHGWVFTGGRYWINPVDVANILVDNGYQAVSQPLAGDVVIYREGDRITHTGLVRTGGNGESVLVESKWGWMGQFVHAPGGTCYGRSYTYYRSPRRGHVLLGLPGEPARLAADVGRN